MSDPTAPTTADTAAPPPPAPAAPGIDVRALAQALLDQMAADKAAASPAAPSSPAAAPALLPSPPPDAPGTPAVVAPAPVDPTVDPANVDKPAPTFAAGDVVAYRFGDPEGEQVLYGLVIAEEALTFTHPTDPAQNDSVPGVRVAWLHEISAPLRTTDLELA